MSVGTLVAQVVLADPGKMHCGPQDAVEGHIRIRYAAGPQNPNAELFGPLLLHVTFHGRAKTKIWKSNGQTTSIYRGRAPLFTYRGLVYNDSFKAQPGEVSLHPFRLYFPPSVNTRLDDEFNSSFGYDVTPNQPLPPSFVKAYRGWGHHFETFIEYRVGVDISMPHLQLNIATPTKYTEPVVLYHPARCLEPSSRAQPWRGNVVIQNEFLLQEEDRPSGFRQKAKAFIGATNFPEYSFEWTCTAPQDFHLGIPACFEMRIAPHESAAPVIPEVRLTRFHVKFTAHVDVRAAKRLFSAPSSEGNYTVCEMHGVVDDAAPFSKASDWTKIINTRPLGEGGQQREPMTCTFSTFNICLRYTAKISVGFTVTNKIKEFSKEYTCTILPPLETNAMPPPEAGSSSQMMDRPGEPSELPRYESPPSYSKAPEGEDVASDPKGKMPAKEDGEIPQS